MTFYYVAADGFTIPSTTRIDPPDTNHEDYINGNLSQHWETSWTRRLDSANVGIRVTDQYWNFTTSSWYFTKETLKLAVKNLRINLENSSTVSYSIPTSGLTFDIPVSINNLSHFTSPAQVTRRQEPSDMTSVKYDRNKNAVSMSNADFLGMVDIVLNHFQSIIDAEVALVAQVDAETLTDTASIGDVFSTAMASPLPHLNPIVDLYGTINGKADKTQVTQDISDAISNLLGGAGAAVDTLNELATLISNNEDAATALTLALGNKQDKITPAANIVDAMAATQTNLLTSYSPSSGYNTVINDGINISNAAYNDLAAKHNDLVNKFNTLLTHLESQGLQLP